MKNYVYKIEHDTLDNIDFPIQNEINQSKDILIQLFSGENPSFLEKLLSNIQKTFPKAFILTATTDGEIIHDKVLTHSSVLSITTFQETSLKFAYSENKDSFLMGQELAQQLTTDNTKLIISFANSLACNGEEFLKGVHSVNPQTMIAGGLSADNGNFKKCHIGLNENLYDRGAVGVSLNSDTLSINNFYNFGWQAIGIKHTVTKAKKNRVYTIDNLTTVDFYRKYLGESVADKLPQTAVEFPLIVDVNGFKKARAATAVHKDGSFSFAGNIIEGEKVYIGVGEIQTILSTSIDEVCNMNVETFFIYSCMARRRFLPDLIHQEIEPFAQIAPTSGFFTYGEFFTNDKPELLNQTLTAVALSESSQKRKKQKKQKKLSSKNTTFKALMHIINITSQELHEQTQLQEKIQNELNAKTHTLELIQEMSNLANWEVDLKTLKITWSKRSYQIYNVSPLEEPPTYLEFLNMVVPQDRKKLIDFREKLNDSNVHSVEIAVKRYDNKILHMLESAKLVFENGKPIKVIGTSLDITDIKMKDTLLMQQAKSAQMGEMINMIAHQWRQPLNAISSAGIKLNMQSEMDVVTKEMIRNTTQFIEDMTQKMSQTINDFMDFSKPSHTKEIINFQTILDDILKIIGTQLKNHNITLESTIEKTLQFYTYKKELEHILINLIINARDALETLDDIDKKIMITVYSKHKLLIIKVADNGGGIDDNIINRVFDPYFTTKESSKGTGLGLYMSKKILQEHMNGDIYVRNKDLGAEFTIILDELNE